MPTHITYGGKTYIDVEYDLEDTINRLSTILNSPTGAGILVVTTKSRPVHLLVSRTIPLVLEHKDTVDRKAAQIF